jgi:glycosyltransferase involved in cell wall biosynthesis
MSEPHIVVVNDFAHINGGAAQVALGSAMALAGRGHPVTVFASVPPVMPELAASGVRVVLTDQHDILTDPSRRRAAVQGIWNRKAAQMMGELLDGLSPADTVVHLHGWTKAISPSAVHAALSRRFKVVCTLHEYFIACPNGGFFNYQGNHICRLRAMSTRCLLSHCDARSYPQKLWRFERHMVQRTLGGVPRRLHAFIALSRLSREVLAPYLPPGVPVHEVQNPIEAAKEEPVPVEDNDTFIAAGRLAVEKGLDLFAAATAETGVPAVLVGDGPLRDQISALNPAMEITGWQPHSGVVRRMKRARALVFPSIWYETLGLVVLEAAALGVPAIVPDTCAARDSVEDGVTGLWFRGGDARDLAAKIRRLADPAEAHRLGRAAHERYWRNPRTMERHVDGLRAVYRSVIAG